MSRILFATFGSLGDLHPLIAIALEMQRRGHAIGFCTSETYGAKLESLGFDFNPMRPDATPGNVSGEQLIKEIFDPKRGAERLLCRVLLPHLRDSYQDLRRAATEPRQADLLVCGELVYAAPLLAEQLHFPWATYITTPMSFFSAHDLPILPPVPRLSAVLRRLGPGAARLSLRLIKWVTRNWGRPVRELRAELNLPPVADPVYEGKFSPHLVMAGFSPVLASPQPDWPPKTLATGFPFYDGANAKDPLPRQLVEFLDRGEPPIVFTLGSSAVLDPGSFYNESARAAGLLNRRAVLLVGQNPPPTRLPQGVVAFDYVGFSKLFPRAAAVVHQGGIGTTGQTLRAGVPMLVMPFAFDQPDNAARVVRLGTGRTLSRGKYSAKSAAAALRMLLEDPGYRQCAEKLAAEIARENGAATAAKALEGLLR